MATVLQDILNEELAEDNIRIQVRRVYEFARGDFTHLSKKQTLARSRSPVKAKSLNEFYTLVKTVVDSYENRAGTSDKNKVVLTEEEPDINAETETITLSLVKRDPGAFDGGAPFEGKIRNLRPMTREEIDDPDNPDYKLCINGYWYDNIVRFTCWAKTNKAANKRAEWLEDMMEEYSWFFKAQGVDRCMFWGRHTDIVIDVGNNQRWYGRPIDFFVRTEKLRVLSEKKIEEIIIKLVTKQE